MPRPLSGDPFVDRCRLSSSSTFIHPINAVTRWCEQSRHRRVQLRTGDLDRADGHGCHHVHQGDGFRAGGPLRVLDGRDDRAGDRADGAPTRTEDDHCGNGSRRRRRHRSQNRDKEITVTALQAQLKALGRWGSKAPADLSQIHQPVLVANGDRDRMVPSVNSHDLARRIPNRDLIIYPDSGHGAVFQFHADFVPKALEFLAR